MFCPWTHRTSSDPVQYVVTKIVSPAEKRSLGNYSFRLHLHRNIKRDKMTYSLHSNLHHLVMNNARKRHFYSMAKTLFISYFLCVLTRKEKDDSYKTPQHLWCPFKSNKTAVDVGINNVSTIKYTLFPTQQKRMFELNVDDSSGLLISWYNTE